MHKHGAMQESPTCRLQCQAVVLSVPPIDTYGILSTLSMPRGGRREGRGYQLSRGQSLKRVPGFPHKNRCINNRPGELQVTGRAGCTRAKSDSEEKKPEFRGKSVVPSHTHSLRGKVTGRAGEGAHDPRRILKTKHSKQDARFRKKSARIQNKSHPKTQSEERGGGHREGRRHYFRMGLSSLFRHNPRGESQPPVPHPEVAEPACFKVQE